MSDLVRNLDDSRVSHDTSQMSQRTLFCSILALMLGKKQFEYMMVASDKRYKELDEKKKQCHELQGVS